MKYLISIAYLICSLVSLANNDFNEGNAAYKDQRYEDAVEAYQKIVDDGLESPELYYNLGNAYFKLNDLAHAKLYLEKAHKLAPNDEDIIYNLDSIANPALLDKTEIIPAKGINAAMVSVVASKGKNFWSWTAILLCGFGFLSLCAFLFVGTSKLKQIAFYSGITAIVLGIVAIGLAYFHKNHLNSHEKGVIMSESVEILNEPSANAEMLFELHEGTTVEIIEENNEWYRIEIDKLQGWMSKEDLEQI
jgi:tetratricopeptide (TPR) repeat protein